MNINRLCVFLLLSIMVSIMPVSASANAGMDGMEINVNGFTSNSTVDSNPQKQPGKKDDKKGDKKKQDGKKVKGADIKEVPKATRKLKPAAVKTKVKIPVKRVKPVIKKPVGLIRKISGI